MSNVNRITFAKTLIYLVRWFSFERAIGFSLLFSATVMAFEPLRAGSLMELLVTETGLDPFIASNWYLVGGFFLIFKGQKASFLELLLVVMPVLIITVTALLVGAFSTNPDITVSGSDVAREFMIGAVIFQRLLSKMTIELIEKVGDLDTRS